MFRRLNVFVSGIVQNVGFRYFVLSRAQPLGITGFVRNDEDGSIEIVAEAEEDLLKNFLEEIKRGPPAAVIKKISVNWIGATGGFVSFRITY